MCKSSKLVFLNFIFLAIIVQICFSETQHLSLYSPDASLADAEYAEVLIKHVGDNLTLVCEVKGDQQPRLFVWNYVAANDSFTSRPFSVQPAGPAASSRLWRAGLTPADSGHYLCSSPPHSVTKFVLVQEPPPSGAASCARGAMWCGARCVLPTYVCDGRADCASGEDEAPPLCHPAVCQRSGMLNCSSGRCISAAACCPPARAALCLQHACCLEHEPYRSDGFPDVEFPASYEDKHAPDQYGFIQSTIYTVTACALIFMIAAVLLVSAICKMHMKRAALRSCARAAHQRHYAHPPARFPPCYEASRLLEQEAARQPLDPAMQTTPDPVTDETADNGGFGLSRLSAIFSSRYRQVPTECEVEMTTVGAGGSLPSSPRPRLPDYRSPTYCDLTSDYLLSSETGNCGRELNYMSPGDMYRRGLELDRRLTLQLGRFQLSLPRRARDRPATPNVADIADLDVVQLNSDETYTLNGRTIRLLGGDYPRPPPYWQRKPRAGPPPAYRAPTAPAPAPTARDLDADDNREMPPRYEDVNSNEEHIERTNITLNAIRESGESLNSTVNMSTDNIADMDNMSVDNVTLNNITLDNAIDNTISNEMETVHGIDSSDIPAIDDVNANEIVGD